MNVYFLYIPMHAHQLFLNYNFPILNFVCVHAYKENP